MNSFYILLFSYLYTLISSISIDNIPTEGIMYIKIGEKMFSLNIYDNPISKELISLLPIKSVPVDKNNMKYFSLGLEIEEEDSLDEKDLIIKADAGDVLLYKKKEIIIVNRKINFDNYNGEYIKLGYTKFTNELHDTLKYNKPVYLWNSFNYQNYNEKIKPHEYYMSIMNFLTWKIVTIFCFLFL